MMFDGLDTDGRGDMRLARAGTADQDDVVGLVEEVAAMKLADQRLVDLTAGEVEAVCSLVRSLPMIAQSSDQSNWKASPGSKARGTNVPRPVVWNSLCRSAFHSRAKAATRQ
jgi:hypothetical protein